MFSAARCATFDYTSLRILVTSAIHSRDAISVLGICGGHQISAWLGARVVTLDSREQSDAATIGSPNINTGLVHRRT